MLETEGITKNPLEEDQPLQIINYGTCWLVETTNIKDIMYQEGKALIWFSSHSW